MTSAFITVRTTATGEKRYIVRFRLGGRETPLLHAGTKRTQREAKLLRDFVAGELAAGRNPLESLRSLAESERTRSLSDWAETWLASRVDLSDRSRRAYRPALKRISAPPLGARNPTSLQPSDIQEWVGANASLSPSTLRTYMGTLRQLLDFAGLEPNPARHRSVRLPYADVEEIEPPSAEQVRRLLAYVPAAFALPLVTIEQTGMRVNEPAELEWRDVDLVGARFRIRSETAKGRRGRRVSRWVQVPPWLMDAIAASCPPDDRTAARRVFPGFNAKDAWRAMERACRAAGIPHYHPHDLRHRRLSLWHGQGVPARELADRAGHANPSMSLDRYTHVMPLDELPRETLEALLVTRR